MLLSNTVDKEQEYFLVKGSSLAGSLMVWKDISCVWPWLMGCVGGEEQWVGAVVTNTAPLLASIGHWSQHHSLLQYCVTPVNHPAASLDLLTDFNSKQRSKRCFWTFLQTTLSTLLIAATLQKNSIPFLVFLCNCVMWSKALTQCYILSIVNMG